MAIARLLVDTSKKNNGIFNCFAKVRSTPKKMAIEFQTCPEFGQAFRVEYWTYFKKIKYIFYFPKNGFSSPPWKFWAGSGQACPEILSAVFSRKMTVIYNLSFIDPPLYSWALILWIDSLFLVRFGNGHKNSRFLDIKNIDRQ